MRRHSKPLLDLVEGLGMLGLAICALLALGTVGYVIAEGTSVGFGFVWALDTVATVGSIPGPDSTAGQVVKALLIVFGVGTLFYALVTVTEFFVAGHLAGLLEERRTLRKIDSYRDHMIICGFGRVGRQAARDLRAAGCDFVVLDNNPDETREHAEAMGAPFVEGSPSDDEVLRSAGIMRAAGIMACVDSDAENIFITLTARELRSDLTIVARASVEDSESKLRRAGADRIVSPYKTSGSQMVRLALHPQVTGVVDVAPEYRMEEIEVTVGCAAAGRTIEEIRGSASVVAVRRDGRVEPQPAPETVLRDGDVLVAIGETAALEKLETQLAPA
ncbi:MAG TPA: TrkA family potassium uptake protein [Solirubrobacterales bacterium]|nr:TrkA family potassium uptake protein [Solirubrobacterales bacterium]